MAAPAPTSRGPEDLFFGDAGNSTALGNMHVLNSLLQPSPLDILQSDNGNLQRAYHRNII